MPTDKTVIERAFDLARSGQYSTVSEIRTRLRVEGYTIDQLIGPTLKAQLAQAIRAARADRP